MIAGDYTIMRMIVNINLGPESWRNLRARRLVFLSPPARGAAAYSGLMTLIDLI